MPFDARPIHRRSIRLRVLRAGSVLTLVTAGCASDYSVEDPNFGASVRHMVAVQTADPNRGATGLDGEKAGAALRAYREDVGDTEAPGNVSLTISSE